MHFRFFLSWSTRQCRHLLTTREHHQLTYSPREDSSEVKKTNNFQVESSVFLKKKPEYQKIYAVKELRKNRLVGPGEILTLTAIETQDILKWAPLVKQL